MTTSSRTPIHTPLQLTGGSLPRCQRTAPPQRTTSQQPMTAVSRTSRVTGLTATRSAAASARPRHSTRLPISGWQLRWRLQPEGRTILEVTDQAGELTGLVASTRLPIVSVDGAWRGTCHGADGARQRWALAIGHACTPDRLLTVTFTRRLPGSRRARAARRHTRRPWTGGGPPSPGTTP